MKYSTAEENRFRTIGEFEDCLIRGGEIVFVWKNIEYGLFGDSRGYCMAHIDGNGEKWVTTLEELLYSEIEGDLLRDIITEVEVIERMI